MTYHILIVDDDAMIRRSLAFNLEEAGYRPTTAENAEDALAAAHRDPPDLVLLDIGLPGMSGMDALQQFKQQVGVRVIFLTARSRKLDQIIGLEMGADDYIIKPFDIDILIARVKSVLRRSEEPLRGPSPAVSLQVGDLSIDPGAHTVRVAGRLIDLTRREFNLLHALALQPNRVLSIQELLDQVWGAEFTGEPQVVYVHVRWLREKIEADPDNPERILSVRGVGYKLLPKEPLDPDPATTNLTENSTP